MNLLNVKRVASTVALAGIAATGLVLGAGVASATPHNETVKQFDSQYECGKSAADENFKHRKEGVTYYCATNNKGVMLWVRRP